jgi:hypothetical protein
MQWQYWVLFGLALLAMEILAGTGFYLLFLGLAAMAVGAAVGLGILEATWLQWVLFSVVSIVSVLVFRGPLLERIKSRERTQNIVDSLIGEVATPIEDLAPGATGKAELRGTTWTVRNGGSTTLSKGQRGRVVRVEGLTLWITSE